MVANDGLIPSESTTLEMSRIIYARPIFYYVHKSNQFNSILTHIYLDTSLSVQIEIRGSRPVTTT